MIGKRSRKKDPTAAPPYLSHFALREAPFANGDTRYFYADPEREQALNMLLHLTQYSEELLLVSGPIGAGKSKVLEQYLGRADEHWKVCRIGAAEASDAGQMFIHIAECFGLDAGKSDNILGALQGHLQSLQEQLTAVLVVDDAHAISDDALEIVLRLAQLEGEHGKLLRVILFAEASLLARLGAERFQEVPRPHQVELKPLDEAQTAAYLQHRLVAAGFSGQSPFSPKEVKRIHKAAQGLPGAINREAHQILVERMEVDKSARGGVPWRVIGLGVLGVVIIATAISQYDRLLALLPSHSTPTAVDTPPPPAKPVVTANKPAVTPIQPIVRLQDGSNGKFSIVLRPGQSINVACAASGAAYAPAAPAGETPPRVETPLIKPITTPGATSAVPASTPMETTAKAPQKKAPLAVKQPAPVSPTIRPEVVAPESPVTPSPSGSVQKSEKSQPTPAAAEKGVEVAQPHAKTLEAAAPAQEQTLAKATGKTGAEAPPPKTAVPSTPPSVAVHAPSSASPAGKAKGKEPAKRSVPGPIITPVITRIEPNPVTGNHQRQAITLIGTGFGKGAHVTVHWPGHSKTLPADQIRVIDPRHLQILITTGVQSATWLVEVANSERTASATSRFDVVAPKVAPALRLKTTQRQQLLGPDWVKDQSANAYTVQIFAATDATKVNDFIHQARPAPPLALITTRKGGQSYQVLLQGRYPDRQRAEAAAAKLPKVIQQQGPWVRPFGDLQKALVAAAPFGAGTPMHHEAWIRSRTPGHFTLQLAGGTSIASINGFLDDHPRPAGPLALMRSERSGKPWYTLMYGDFADRTAAEQALKRLPAPLRTANPWLRSFADIQQTLAKSTR